jgi:hypothetical protein
MSAARWNKFPKKISQNNIGWTSVKSMLNFSRLSRRTHRIVKARISCQYSFMTLPSASLRSLLLPVFLRLVILD